MNKKQFKNRIKKTLAMVLSVCAIMGGANPVLVMADATEADKTYVSLGADLSADQRQNVLSLLGITEEELANYKVTTVTNAEEHAAYDNYLDKSVIGTRALSCAKVVQKEEGYGLQVTTKNIDYCTTAMYQNAMATAGMKDADVVVAGPIQLSGTAALLGVTKAYSEMTGEPLKAESIDAAAQELVVTSDLGEEAGDQEKAAQLIASVKEAVAEGNLDENQIGEAIDKAAQQLNINVSGDLKIEISNLMKKIDGLDLDVESLKKQAGDIYDSLKDKGIDLGISKEKALNWFQKIIEWFKNLWSRITGK